MNTTIFTKLICLPADCRKNFVPSALPPIDSLRVIVEQLIYCSFVDRSDIMPNPASKTYIDKILEHFDQLPDNIYTGNSALDNIYHASWELIRNRVDQTLSVNPALAYDTLKSLLNTTQIEARERDYRYNNYYVGGLPEGVFDEWAALVLDYVDTVKYPDGIIKNAPLLIPSMRFQKSDDYLHVTSNAKDRIIFTVEVAAKLDFNIENRVSTAYTPLYYLSCFDFKDYSINDIIGLLASFCIHHKQYDMTFGGPVANSLSAICFDLVTGSSYVKDAGLDNREINTVELDCFINWVKKLISVNQFQPIKDYDLFGELLALAGEDPAVVNYFTKPVKNILAAEAFAFQNSVYSSMVSDRLAGVEALDDEIEDDTLEDDTDTSTSDDVTLDQPDDSSDLQNQDEAPIDPNKMLLELNTVDPNLRDYLFREIVSKRIDSILKNPPENVMPNDLLLLKRWRSRWLYLTSIACLKDFLMRLAVRLSDD